MDRFSPKSIPGCGLWSILARNAQSTGLAHFTLLRSTDGLFPYSWHGNPSLHPPSGRLSPAGTVAPWSFVTLTQALAV